MPIEVHLERFVFVEVPVEIEKEREIFKAESHREHNEEDWHETMRMARVVEKIVEVPVDRIVEKEVVREVERIVEKEVVVEKPV